MEPTTTIVEVRDADFAWMLRNDGRRRRGFVLPPGGVDDQATLAHVRAIAARLRAAGYDRGAWMIVCDNEVVGLCGYHHSPGPDGFVEIGYGIAGSRRGRGHATRAVAAMIAYAARDPAVHLIVAETSLDNVFSIRVLEKNHFERAGERPDPHTGAALIFWRRDVNFG